MTKEAGKEYLEKHEIVVHSDRIIGVIENWNRTGICPFEKSVKDIDIPEEGFEEMKKTMTHLRKNV